MHTIPYLHILHVTMQIFLKVQELPVDPTYSKSAQKLTRHIWGFPKIGVPLFIIHSNGIFHYKPSILGTHIHGTPQISGKVLPDPFDLAIVVLFFFDLVADAQSVTMAGKLSSDLPQGGPSLVSRTFHRSLKFGV